MVAASTGVAHAQNGPFQIAAIPISAAFGAERALAHLTAPKIMLNLSPTYAKGVGDAFGAATTDDLPLFLASLKRQDTALADALVQALAARGSSSTPEAAQVAHAEALAQRAAQALAANLGGSDTKAAVLALVLAGPGGLSETFAEAVDIGDRVGMAVAWSLLQRGHILWRALRGSVSPEQRKAVDDAFGHLDAIIPAPTSDSPASPGSADEADRQVNQIVATMGAALHSSLVPDSDLTGLAATVTRLARRGCAPEAAARNQELAVSSMFYAGYLSPIAAMLASDDETAVQKAFSSLADGAGSRPEICRGLIAALGRVSVALGA